MKFCITGHTLLQQQQMTTFVLCHFSLAPGMSLYLMLGNDLPEQVYYKLLMKKREAQSRPCKDMCLCIHLL